MSWEEDGQNVDGMETREGGGVQRGTGEKEREWREWNDSMASQ